VPTETVTPVTLKKKNNTTVSAKTALEGGKQGVVFIAYQYVAGGI